MNKHPVDVYAVLPEDIYLYDPVEHQLLPVAEGDYRRFVGKQDYVYNTPLNLLYVADTMKLENLPRPPPEGEKLKWVYVEAGPKLKMSTYTALQKG